MKRTPITLEEAGSFPRCGRLAQAIWRIEVVFRALRDYLIVPVVDVVLRRKSYSEIARQAVPTIEFIRTQDALRFGLHLKPVAARVEREHQWPAETVLSEGHRLVGALASLSEQSGSSAK